MRERLLADDLDVLRYANATAFGGIEPELALFHRVAPVQMTLNSHVPMAPSFDSFDYFLTDLSDDPAVEISDTSSPERILRVQGPVINYINSLTPNASNNITRATLGLAEDDIVMINAAKHPVFVASADYSKSMEKTLLACLNENDPTRDEQG